MVPYSCFHWYPHLWTCIQCRNYKQNNYKWDSHDVYQVGQNVHKVWDYEVCIIITAIPHWVVTIYKGMAKTQRLSQVSYKSLKEV